jgi:monofunctional biosynthetic peptidoglycan transglycosylase
MLARTNPTRTAFMDMRQEEAASEGKTLRHVYRWVPYSRISQNLKRAVLVAEDDAFWDHDGVDYKQLRQSIEINLERGAAVRGASTITQQLAKNLYLSSDKNPISGGIRKLRELIIARRLEADLPKARILEIYLNVIEWGDGIWGAEAAARTYFGTSAASLSADQSALLAAAIINPRILNPGRPSARLLRRQRMIRGRMGGVTPPAPVPVPAAESDDENATTPPVDPNAPTAELPTQTTEPLTPGAPTDPSSPPSEPATPEPAVPAEPTPAQPQ